MTYKNAVPSVNQSGQLTAPQEFNFIATETGANNAIAASLIDATGQSVLLAAGLQVTVKLAHSLQIGANTFALNGVAKNIRSHLNPANNLTVAYVVGGLWTGTYDGTEWLDAGQ